jgi:ribosomal protein S12 methylthiotransferase accessory factor
MAVNDQSAESRGYLFPHGSGFEHSSCIWYGYLMMHYTLEHQGTESGTGQFACTPREPVDFEDALQYIQNHPNDDFMHRHLLHLVGQFGPNLSRELIRRAKDEENPWLLTLMYESCILSERLHDLKSEFRGMDLKALARYTPLITVNWSLREDPGENEHWIRLFSENICGLTPPSGDDARTFPGAFSRQAVDAWARRVVSIGNVVHRGGPGGLPPETGQRPGAAETAARAMERLRAIDFRSGPVEENPASLSPHAIQMSWILEIRVSTGRDQWELAGIQTSYGKGPTGDDARASCTMEVVERISSFASFDSRRVLGYKEDHVLVRARYEDLPDRSRAALEPNEMRLEVPYENQPLYWIGAERIDEDGTHPVLVPVQLVFLFCNLDEVSLTSGLPSTGLASGNTLEEAKLHALLEVIERDCERIMPFAPQRCFLLESHVPTVKAVQERSRDQGVEVVFLDITSELGVPCYKAFIRGPDGEILKGCAAHLDGQRAALSALTEVPFHPSWFRPAPLVQGLQRVKHENLPNYSSGYAAQDLQRLESLLVANGYRPVYVNLTRKDLDIPVVKALVPGLELFAEFDPFSNLSFRQFAHYVRALP